MIIFLLCGIALSIKKKAKAASHYFFSPSVYLYRSVALERGEKICTCTNTGKRRQERNGAIKVWRSTPTLCTDEKIVLATKFEDKDFESDNEKQLYNFSRKAKST